MERNNNEIVITGEEAKVCKICTKIFTTPRLRMWHVKKEHGLNFEEYVLKVYYDDIRPICLKSGNHLSFKAHQLGPWFSNYSKNNFPRKEHAEESKQKIKLGCEKTSIEKFGVKNVFQADWCKEKIKKTLFDKYGETNPMKVDELKNKMIDSLIATFNSRPPIVFLAPNINSNHRSSLEIDFESKLKGANIEYVSPFIYEGKKYDFYIPTLNLILEIDGEAFHKDVLEFLTLKTINGSTNDFKKNNIITNSSFKLERIRYDIDTFIFNTTDELLTMVDKHNYTPNYNLKYKQKIIKKEYFERYIKHKGSDHLKKYSYLFLKFIRTFQPTLPCPDLEEDLKVVIDKISKYDLSKCYFKGDIAKFNNNISTIGHNYLKHHFHSYWDSSFKGYKSPKGAWLDDKIMQDVIDYRIGCNNSNEVFDFSLYQLVRGLSAKRITISFFKPMLAATIYTHYLGDKTNPIVLDPCCGFGGRLLGFKSRYKDGTYVGCEPNKETYNELCELVKSAGWKDVYLYNCKFEEFNNTTFKFDLVFTSIPYYDLEIYSNNPNYTSFDNWKDTFIKKFYEYSGNCYINCPNDLALTLNWNNIDTKIVSSTSHYDKNDTKEEVIVKI